MSCGTCGIQASNTMQEDTGVPAGAPQTQRPRCTHCKAFISQEGAPCRNPRCPGIATANQTPPATPPWVPTPTALRAASPAIRAALDNIMGRALHRMDADDDGYDEARQVQATGTTRRRFEVLESMVAQDLLQGDPERDDHIHEVHDALAAAYGNPEMTDDEVVALARRHYWDEGILYDHEGRRFLDKHPPQVVAARAADEALIDISGAAPRLIYRVGMTIVEVRGDGSQMVAPWDSAQGAQQRMRDIRKQAAANARTTTTGRPGLMCPRCHGALYEAQSLCPTCTTATRARAQTRPTPVASSDQPLARFGRLLKAGSPPVLTPDPQRAPDAAVLYHNVGGQVAAVSMESEGVSLDLAGFGTHDAAVGAGGGIVHLDCHRADSAAPWAGPTLYVWADINQEDPTHAISLAGAREDQRAYDPEEDGGDNPYDFDPPPEMPWDQLPPLRDTTPPRMDSDGLGNPLLTRRLATTGLAATMYPHGVDLDVEGWGTFSTRPGCGGGVVSLDLADQSHPRLLVWGDINLEDPTHEIDLSGAAESRRKTAG